MLFLWCKEHHVPRALLEPRYLIALCVHRRKYAPALHRAHETAESAERNGAGGNPGNEVGI